MGEARRQRAKASRAVAVDQVEPGGGGWLLETEETVGPAVLRWTLAVVMFPHGAQKLLGWFGGAGFDGSMQFLTGTMALPAIVALAVITIEFLAPIALALGAFTRAAAAGIGAVMVGAVLTSHLEHGFFMNWSGAQAGQGFEYHLLAVGLALALVIRGGGAVSVDRWLTRGEDEALDTGPEGTRPARAA